MAAIEVATEASEAQPRAALDRLSLVLTAVSIGTTVPGFVLGLRPSPANALEDQNILGSLATLALSLLFTGVGVVLRRRRPENAVGWLVLGFGVTVSITSLIWGVTYTSGLPDGNARLGTAVALIGTIATMPSWFGLITSLIVRFPSGEPGARTDRRVLRISLVTCTAMALFLALRPGQFLVYPGFSSPLSLDPSIESAVSVGTVLAVVAALLVLATAALRAVDRYRDASQVERLQLRWFAFAGLIALTGGS